MKIIITNKATGEKATITRDVCANHPKWVHDQCGTRSESELQACLDGLNVEMWYRGDKHLGPDTSGIEMFRDKYIILSEHAGEYVTRIHWQRDGRADVHTGKAADAIEYTKQEADEVAAALGRGFTVDAIEDALS